MEAGKGSLTGCKQEVLLFFNRLDSDPDFDGASGFRHHFAQLKAQGKLRDEDLGDGGGMLGWMQGWGEKKKEGKKTKDRSNSKDLTNGGTSPAGTSNANAAVSPAAAAGAEATGGGTISEQWNSGTSSSGASSSGDISEQAAAVVSPWNSLPQTITRRGTEQQFEAWREEEAQQRRMVLLPPHWSSQWDRARGAEYYHNKETGGKYVTARIPYTVHTIHHSLTLHTTHTPSAHTAGTGTTPPSLSAGSRRTMRRPAPVGSFPCTQVQQSMHCMHCIHCPHTLSSHTVLTHCTHTLYSHTVLAHCPFHTYRGVRTAVADLCGARHRQ
jgi:hypothetical protein